MPLAKNCATSGCRTLTAPGHRWCPYHADLDRVRRNQRVKDYGYSSPRWQRVRVARLSHSRGLCELRLPGCTLQATHVHLDPALKGQHQQARIENTRACCASCSGAVDAPRAHA